MNFFESIYAESEVMTNSLNHWLLVEGGNEIVRASGFWAVWALAIICFVGLLFEKRNSQTKELAHDESTLYVVMNVINWGLGTLGSFIMFSAGSFWTGIGLLALIYTLPISRSYSAKTFAFFLNQIPGIFHVYTKSEKKERYKKMSLWMHKKFRCDLPEMVKN